ncbi:MAG: mobile mystery protein B [Alphaproteobacteria bacterium]|nr:mobile mystery protein B [Alphaproteobacteria bacterium]
MQYHYIAGQTPLDEEEKRALIPSLVTREDLNAFEQENILLARQWVVQKTTLNKMDVWTEKFLLNLHKRMFGHVWRWAGTFRKTNKNIGVDRLFIATELHQLIGDAQYWLDHQTYPISDLAVIFHHRLVKIHLFPNGNGRHARLCADVIVAKFDGGKLSWGGNLDLTKPDDLRNRYIAALRDADVGNYEPLLAFARS